jgi:transcriptional regulator of met regulon
MALRIGGGGIQSYNPNTITFGGQTYGGGSGGGTSGQTPTSQTQSQAQSQAQVEANRQAEEQAKKALAEQIEKERQRKLFEANRDYQNNLRNIHSQEERQVELSKLQNKISQIQTNAQFQRVEKGIVTRTTITTGGYSEKGVYTPRTETKYNQSDIVTQVRTGQEQSIQTTQPTKPTSKLGFDTSTYSGRLKYNLIEKDPVLNFLATKIKSFEEKKIKNPTELNKLNQQVSDRLKEITPKGESKGFSLTQKYYEAFGTKFYKKGEREQITKDVLNEFNQAKTYEEQQKAITNLKNKGIKVNEVNGNYQVDTSNIAPTNKLGNILVGATDIMFKGKVFSPYMTTGAVKKTTQKVKLVEKAKPTKRLKDLTLEEQSAYINNIRVTKTLQELREAYSKALRTGNEVLVKDTETILKEVLGTETASTLIRDVTAQEGLVSSPNVLSARVQPKTTIQIDLSDVFNVKAIKGVPESATGINILNVDRNKNIFFESSKFKDQTGTSKFKDQTGTSKYNEQTSTMFKDLGVTKTRFDTLEKVKQQESQKNILGLKAPQSEILKLETQIKQKQPQKSLLGLVGLLKTKQQQKQVQIQKQLFKERFKQSQPQKPTFKLPPFIWGEGGLKSRLKNIVESPELFEVFGKRFGKEISLLKTTSKQKAEEETFKFLKGTLGRSARILKSGKPLEFNELNLLKSYEFRPAKRESTRIVQKAEFSLGTGAEVSEIQMFKRKGKKSKWGI